MSRNHSHSGCGHESYDHDHNHNISEDGGPEDNLFRYIDRDNVVALNTSGCVPGSVVIKPWHKRLDEEQSLESDADVDDQIIIRIPFTGSVQLRALLLKSGPTDHTPSKVALFAHENNIDFNDIDAKEPTQEFNVAQGNEVGKYTVRATQFSNLTYITLFFPGSQGADTTRIFYVGFLGTWRERKDSPVVTVYEKWPNLADHEKVQGTDHGGLSQDLR